MDLERWSSKYSMDEVMPPQSPYPQFADAKRRRKTPPPTVPLEGKFVMQYQMKNKRTIFNKIVVINFTTD